MNKFTNNIMSEGKLKIKSVLVMIVFARLKWLKYDGVDCP